ncbi:MAG: hypothetical protein SO435_06265 [Peptostreptococcus porci]|nr:hypothetical protein [Peptostreptococcus porci]
MEYTQKDFQEWILCHADSNRLFLSKKCLFLLYGMMFLALNKTEKLPIESLYLERI